MGREWETLCSRGNTDTNSSVTLLTETMRSAGMNTSAAGLVPWTVRTSCPRCFSGRKVGSEGTGGAA